MGQPGLKIFRDLAGGLASRPTPLIVDVTSENRLRSPLIKNVNPFKKGSLAKRAGVTQYGDDVTAIVPFSTQSTDSDAITVLNGYPSTKTMVLAYRFTTPNRADQVGITEIRQKLSVEFDGGSTANLKFAIYGVDSGTGNPSYAVSGASGFLGWSGFKEVNVTSSTTPAIVVAYTNSGYTYQSYWTGAPLLSNTGYFLVTLITVPANSTKMIVRVAGLSPNNQQIKTVPNPTFNSNLSIVEDWDYSGQIPVTATVNPYLLMYECVLRNNAVYVAPNPNFNLPFFMQGVSSSTWTITSQNTTYTKSAIATKFTAGSTKTMYNALFDASAYFLTGSVNAYLSLYTDSSGPSAIVTNGTSNPIALSSSTSPASLTFTWAIPPTLTSGVSYWLVFWVDASPGTLELDIYTLGTNSGSSKLSTTYTGGKFTTWSADQGYTPFYAINALSQTEIINGLYDYRAGTSSTQKVMACAGGNLDYYAGPGYTSLITGLGSGQNNLWCFATMKDLLITTDYGNNPGRVWDQAAAYTIKHGFRATFTAAEDTTGSIANGAYKIMAVTTLKSGGYRASEVKTVTITGGKRIKLSSIVMDGTGALDFGFDIAATATVWYMTAAGGSTYYKIPTANLSTANPSPNNTTTAYITSLTGLTTSTTLLDDYNIEQGYFTGQVAAPTAKYTLVWNSMLIMAGTGDSKLWMSEANAPNIWSTYGGLQGGFEPINTNDGADIDGLYVDDGFLYVMKKNSTFMVQYTQNANAPIAVRQISAKVGALSHWGSKTIPNGGGFAMLSSSGPVRVSGSTITPLPGSEDILDRFDPGDANSYNLDAMYVCTAGINPTMKVIKWGVSSHTSTTRDKTLCYNYELGVFWEDDAFSNYYTEITDANFYPSIWGGGYQAKVLRYDYGTNDDGNPIDFLFRTPHMQCGGVTQTTRWSQLHLAGAEQTSGLLTVKAFLNQSTTPSQTIQINMATGLGFGAGFAVPLGLTGKSIQFELSNSELNVPVRVDSIGISFEVLRESYGAA